MILRNPLILAALERREVTPIALSDKIGDIAAGIIPRLGDRTRVRERVDRERRRLTRKTFVDEHVLVDGMVDDHQRHVIDEVRLPQLGGDADVVDAVARDELVAANLHPVFRLRDTRRVDGVDAQPERRSPQEVRDEPHVVTVVREHPRARSLEPLLGDDDLVGLAVEVGLHDSVGPEDPRDVYTGARAKTEVHRLAGENLFLRQEAAPDFDLAADAKRVDALIAGRRLRLRTQRLPVVALRAFPEKSNRMTVFDAGEIQLAIAVQVGDAENVSLVELAVLKGPL